MESITEVSVSFFESSFVTTPKENKVEEENISFLRYLEDITNSDSEEAQIAKEVPSSEENSIKVEEEISEITEGEKSPFPIFLPKNWEISESFLEREVLFLDDPKKEKESHKDSAIEISDGKFNIEESLELQLSEENFIEGQEIFPEDTGFSNINYPEVQTVEKLTHDIKTEIKTENETREDLSNVNFEMEVLRLEKKDPQDLKFETEFPLERESFYKQSEMIPTSKTKLENTKAFLSSNLQVENFTLENKEARVSSDLLSLLKDKISFSREEKIEKNLEQLDPKPTFSPNVKVSIKEEFPKNHELKFTSIQEKEPSQFYFGMPQNKINFYKEVNNKSVVHENFKSASELFQKNVQEIIKTAKFQILENGKNLAIIELEPKELGKVLLQISMENEKIQGKLFFETETAKLVFQSELQNLKNELRIAGLEIESLLIDLNDPKQDSKEFFAFENFVNQNTTMKESSSELKENAETEVSQTTKRLVDVRI